ncbi:hypothetical protein EZS27_002198 [termite gut metagenome]|uniref:Uncharacterized protein n=1 Tax=termite gut metagenome TaxID=433724 RepID=A0A5J4SYA8_9ZZZZ
MKVYLNKAEASQKACIVAPYNISEGRLPSIETVRRGDVLQTSLRVPRSFQITDDTTIEDVSTALLQANERMREGDQISILHLIQHVPEKGVPYVTWKQYDFTLDVMSYSTLPSKFYGDIPKSLFRVHEGYIETEAGIEMGGVAYVLSREVGRNMQISTQSMVLTPDNSIYKEYSCEEKRQEAAASYAVVAKKKTITPKKAVGTKMVISKNEYLHGFISRSKKILSMKKIFIALALIFGITIAAQNNTAGQEKIYSQREVDLMMQVQEISERQRSVEDKIGMQDKQIDLFMICLGIIVALAGFIVYNNFNSSKREVKKDLEEIRKIRERARETIDSMVIEARKTIDSVVIEARKTIDSVVIRGEERLSSMVKLEEKAISIYNKFKNSPPNSTQTKKQSKEQKEEISSYTEEIKRKKIESEYTAKDWFLLGYDAQIQKKYEDACYYYGKADEITPNASIYNNWGNALLNLAKLKSTPDLYEESIIKYKKAIESKPDLAEAYNNWGAALLNLARLNPDPALFEESIDKYKKAIEIKPDYAEAYNNWGNALSDLVGLKSDPALYEESIIKYKKAIELKPDYADAYNNWGAALFNHAQLQPDSALFEESIDKYKKAMELKLDYAEAYYNWGIALKRLAQLKIINIEKLFAYLEEYLKYCKSKINRSDIENDVDFAILKKDSRFRDLLDKYFPEEKS